MEEKLTGMNSCDDLHRKRSKLANIVSSSGLTPCIPESGYFMLVDVKKLKGKVKFDDEVKRKFDHQITLWLLTSKALQVLPVSSFYSNKSESICDEFIRLCFIKHASTIDSSEEFFQKLTSLLNETTAQETE